MTKKEIFDYLRNTPENTNFNILSQMLDEFVKNKPVASVEELKSAVAEGGEVMLAGNIELNEPIILTKDAKINLNDKEIIGSAEYKDWYLLKAEGVELTIEGKGLISAGASEKSIPVTAANGGKVKILDGEFACRGEQQCVYANGGTVEIYGGIYKAVEGDTTKDLLNVQNTHNVTDIQVYGGTFIGRDPQLGDDALGGSFVAEGYVSVEIEPGVFEVRQK